MAKKIDFMVGYSKDINEKFNERIGHLYKDGSIFESYLMTHPDATMAELIGIIGGAALGVEEDVLSKRLADMGSEEEFIGYFKDIYDKMIGSGDLTYFENTGFPEV